MRSRRRQDQRGFAMLLVFALASAIAVMLYMQLPRAAFEAQRGKEELLQERGEQYIRAIQLYVTKWKSYPKDVEALEKTNGVRFLRRRYVDPMTGKDDWRLVHVNSAGQLIDSIVQKKPDEKKQNQNTFITEMPTTGTGVNAADSAQNIALRKRPSDENQMPQMGGATPPIDPQSLGNGAQVVSANAPFPQQQPQQGSGDAAAGQTPEQPNGQQLNGQQLNGQQLNGQQLNQPPNGNQQTQQPTQQFQTPGQTTPFNPNMPFPSSAPPGAGTPTPPPGGVYRGQPGTQPGMQPGAQPGAQPGQTPGQNQGLDMVNQLLRQPRQNVPMAVPGAQGLQIGGGLAGIASKAESPSIKIYNERQKYNEWEFVYDMKKDKRVMGAAAGGMNQGANNPNPLGGSQIGGPLSGNQPQQPGNIPNPMVNPPQQQPNIPTFPQPGQR